MAAAAAFASCAWLRLIRPERGPGPYCCSPGETGLRVHFTSFSRGEADGALHDGAIDVRGQEVVRGTAASPLLVIEIYLYYGSVKVTNVHSRRLDCDLDSIGALVDSLSSPDDRLWPRERWPAMRFDGPLAVGARGGHGPIRYVVDAYEQGRRAKFRFTGPAGFHGHHGFEVLEGSGVDEQVPTVVLRHELRMNTSGWATVSWPLLYRPLHDALLEDALDQAALAVGDEPRQVGWTLWVRLLRSVLSRRG